MFDEINECWIIGNFKDGKLVGVGAVCSKIGEYIGEAHSGEYGEIIITPQEQFQQNTQQNNEETKEVKRRKKEKKEKKKTKEEREEREMKEEKEEKQQMSETTRKSIGMEQKQYNKTKTLLPSGKSKRMGKEMKEEKEIKEKTPKTKQEEEQIELELSKLNISEKLKSYKYNASFLKELDNKISNIKQEHIEYIIKNIEEIINTNEIKGQEQKNNKTKKREHRKKLATLMFFLDFYKKHYEILKQSKETLAQTYKKIISKINEDNDVYNNIKQNKNIEQKTLEDVFKKINEELEEELKKDKIYPNLSK